ncbi:aspercryptin biosynthesis cluster-specific transcription regulator atnN [Apiospora rasikravindrae]|uniref:Aspercryptin biosynthesis cluster-specific transcription regulator atnN n=1 Tax=Apiospora rasikravindrae TaxID=990691 RepID=A0ABR1U054_9PEZI
MLSLGASSSRARKVKCDEARPTCSRCRKSGRECDGYGSVPIGSISWSRLLSSGNSAAEARSLDLFRRIAEPVFSGPATNPHWTTTLLQLSTHQGPARHAALAISLLYESSSSNDGLCGSSTSDQQHAAVMYYNRALKCAATERLDISMVLYLSILFTCIEFLRHNAPAAIEHCRHAVHILNVSNDNNLPMNISAIFRHLSVYPFFFGASVSDFPGLTHGSLSYHGFQSIDEVVEAMDSLLARSARLIREFEPRRQLRPGEYVPPPVLLVKWQGLRRDLDIWYAGLSAFRERQSSDVAAAAAGQAELSLYRLLEMRWLVSDIWVDTRLSPDEMVYDCCRGQFERMLTLAREESDFRESLGVADTKAFKFEMAMGPLLHFAVLKCRFLRLRLEILGLFKKISCENEGLWKSKQMEAINRCVIGREHSIKADSLSIDSLLGTWTDEPAVPSKEQRVADYYVGDVTQTYTQPSGCKELRQSIYFHFQIGTQGQMVQVMDWIALPEQ